MGTYEITPKGLVIRMRSTYSRGHIHPYELDEKAHPMKWLTPDRFEVTEHWSHNVGDFVGADLHFIYYRLSANAEPPPEVLSTPHK